MDVHVPRAVITALRMRGVDVLTAQEDGAFLVLMHLHHTLMRMHQNGITAL